MEPMEDALRMTATTTVIVTQDLLGKTVQKVSTQHTIVYKINDNIHMETQCIQHALLSFDTVAPMLNSHREKNCYLPLQLLLS